MNDTSTASQHHLAFLAGGGEMGARIRAHNWTVTPLGRAETWPPPLKTLAGVMLAADQPMFIAWGPERVMLYNDRYAPMLVDRHPAALGRPFFDVWSEVRDELQSLFDQVFAGVPVHMDDIALFLERGGRRREAHFAFSYTPVRDEAGAVVGLFCPCTETTEQVLAERGKAAAAERQRQMFQQMPGFVGVLTGPDHVFEYVNDAYVAVAGRRDFVGRSLRAVFPDLAGQGFYELLDQVYATGEPFTANAMPIRLAGEVSERFIDLLYQPVRGDDGAVTGIFVGGYEVTERCRAESALRAVGAKDSFFARLGDVLVRVDDPRQVMAEAVALLGRHLGAQRVGYGEVQADDVTVVLHSCFADGVAPLFGGYPLDGFGAAMIANHRRGLTQSCDDVTLDPAQDPAVWAAIEARAFASVPLVRDGRFAASLYANFRHPHGWAADELTLMEEVAARTWAAVERARAEERVRALNADLERQVIERTQARGRTWQVSPDLMGALGADGHFATSNPAWQTMLGWSETEVARMPIWDLVHPEDLERTREGFQLTQVGQPALQFANRYRCKNGGYRWISWVGVPEDGMVYCTGRDITAEKQREAELAARTAERDRLWQNAQDVAVVIDTQGVFRSVNPAFTRVLGWTEAQAVGRTVFDFIHPDDLPRTGAALEHAAREELPVVEVRYRHLDGGWRWLAWVAAPEGGLIYANGRHITAEKAAAAELAAAQEALRQSQKMEAVGQLTGGIAHDFNNMLAVVIGSLDLLGRRLDTADARVTRYVEAAKDGARRAALLTQRLLAFSRQQPLQPVAIDVNKLVTGMSDLVRGSLGADIRFETVLAVGGWGAHADPNQLENVLLNLAVNARDAMPGGGRLTIETQNAHLDARYAANHAGLAVGQYVLIAVTDTGCGMPEAVIAKAFDPFFTTKDVGKGTGLGLSQVYGFVKQSGGHVKIYSEPDQGTTVKVYLPRLIGSQHDRGAEDTATGLPRGDIQEVVLVVEDEAAVRQFSVDALNELGYHVLEADGAATALRLLHAHPEIGLLFTDVVMPDVNGRKLADAARQLRPELKVLFTTGYTRNAVVHNGVLDPGVALIGKPFTIEEVAAKVREVLDTPAARQATDAWE